MKRKNKKRLLILFMVLIATIMITGLQANAVSERATLDNIEYSSENIPTEKLERIVKTMYGISEDTGENTRNILCIFGHSKANGTTKIIEHRYYSTAPKCRETISAIEYCTRSGCDYFMVLHTAYNRIVCCP